MASGRNLYKGIIIAAVLACFVGTGWALYSGDVAEMLLCIVAGGILVVSHLNHLSSVGQFARLWSQVERQMQELERNLRQGMTVSAKRIETSIARIDRQVGTLQSKQSGTHKMIAEVQVAANDIVRRAKINHKAIAVAEEEVTKHVIAKSAMTLIALRGLQQDLERVIGAAKELIDEDARIRVDSLSQTIRSMEPLFLQLEQRGESLRQQLGQHHDALHQQLSQCHDALRRQVDQRYDSLRVQAERAPGEVVGLMNAAGDLLAGSVDVPLLGGWAVSASTLTAILNEIDRDPSIETIVECGSGVSTIWCGLACRKRGHGHVYALEHEPRFAEATRSYIRRNELDAWVTVVDSPLTSHLVDGNEYRWYSLDGLDAIKQINLLFVDGPPADTGPMARYPAFQLLAPKLAPDAWVILDDTVRKEERDIANAWCGKAEARLDLVPLHELPKSMVMTVKRRSVD